ncbi:MAG: CHAP domain-containing protein, partial [Hungatella sp.]|nr:CHAP domain-containing protein [Hungatella sp.]
KVYTIEGNTSSGAEVIANGGAVCLKEYALINSRIDGYGRPDWSLVEQPEYTMGWNHDNNGWWYADTKTTYYKFCWKLINRHWYYFNQDGYAVTGWQVIDGKDYYFEPRAGHPLECAMYVTDNTGAQYIGEF